jgi:hypothetical protein
MNNNYDISMLKFLMNSQSEYHLMNSMYKIFIKTYGQEKIKRGKQDMFLYVEGTDPVLLVAHLDTVQRQGKRNIFYDASKQVMWSPQGLGADDRAGVFAIIKILQMGARPHVLLTTDEEIGGFGAMAATKQTPDDFLKDKCKFIIELDRCNERDSVYYYEGNQKFKQFIDSFGFIEDIGSFSDICILSPKWGISSVNVSVGYRMEHTKTEHLYLKHLYKTINKVYNIIIESRKSEILTFEFKPTIENYFDTNIPIYYDMTIAEDRKDIQKLLKTKKVRCDYCHKEINEGLYILEDLSSVSCICETCFDAILGEDY